MAGLFICILVIFIIVFFILSNLSDYYEDEWTVLGWIYSIILISFILAIPIIRIDTKQRAEYIKTFQISLDYNRGNTQDLSVFERATILEEINRCNSTIISWRVKGQKWYNNKWYYHPDTKNVELIK